MRCAAELSNVLPVGLLHGWGNARREIAALHDERSTRRFIFIYKNDTLGSQMERRDL